MSDTVEWASAGSLDIDVIDKDEQIELMTEGDEEEVSPLAFALGNGSSHIYVIEGDLDSLRSLVTRLDAALDHHVQHQLAMECGFSLRDVVQVGNGTKRWHISKFVRMGDEVMAWLESTTGYTNASAMTSRLTKVSPSG